jgi:hypothetical protein
MYSKKSKNPTTDFQNGTSYNIFVAGELYIMEEDLDRPIQS